METYYKDITKKGKVVYYRDSDHRYFRVSKSVVEMEVSLGLAEVDDYVPHKPYEEMTERQLKAALKIAYKYDNDYGKKTIESILNN